MRTDDTELLFTSRGAFRHWLRENAETANGVWLVFGKTDALVTLSATEALEEALCFGWIDGRLKRIDHTKYLKYFARRRPRSPWSEKNKKTVEMLRAKGQMTELGEKAVTAAKRDGRWEAPKAEAVTGDQVEAFAQKLVGITPAYENFNNMSLSVRTTYTRRYLSFKTEKSRQRDFVKIVDRLNKNLKPM